MRGEEDGDLKRGGRWQPQDGTKVDTTGEEYDDGHRKKKRWRLKERRKIAVISGGRNMEI
jgi:hypothetical protein